MKAELDPSKMLRACNRHKARTLTKLEELGCPDHFLRIMSIGFGYLRSDLVEMAGRPKRQSHRIHETK
jgi:hypothetical protein